MKRFLLLAVLIFLAPSITDQLNAEFNQGTHQDTQNISHEIVLLQTNASYVSPGIYTSSVKDLGSNPTATISWNATLPSQTSLIVTSRSGNVPVPNGSWSSWSTAYQDPAGSIVSSPMRRYYQYRLQLSTQNNTVTPAVQLIMLIYTEQGPIVAEASSENDDLDNEYTGAYRFHTSIQDTLVLNQTLARYRIGNGTYSSYENLSFANGYYHIDIPEPGGGWSGLGGQTLTLNVFANNTNTQTNETLTTQILQINQPPIIDPLSNITATEGQTINISVTATDPDADPLTFTSTHGTVQSTAPDAATITWTPSAQQVGNATITVTVDDGQDTDQTSFFATVQPFNYPPVMAPITDQSGHYADRIVFDITVNDPNTNENMTYWVEPNLFSIQPVASNQTGVYRGQANFTALDDHKGMTNLTFYVSDGEYTSSENALLEITYCGDAICQAQENATSCPQDCRATQTTRSYVVLDVPDRFCVNQTATVHVYNASSRYSCFLSGRAYQGAAYCDVYQGATVTIYELLGQQRQQLQSLTTNDQGEVTFTPARPGRYRFLAESDDMMPMDQLVTVNDCSQDISITEEVIERERPDVPAVQPRPTQPPQVERPQLPAQETSLLAILVWYIIIPLLGAALLYTTNAWYEVNKDRNVYVLAARVKLLEVYKRVSTRVKPPLLRAWNVVSPVLTPLIDYIYRGVIVPTVAFVKNIVYRFK